MPIDLVIDERDGTSKPDLGDTNNNSGAHHARASTSHADAELAEPAHREEVASPVDTSSRWL